MIRSRDTLMALEGEALIDGIVRGDSRAVARAISTVERGGADGLALSSRLFSLGGRALVVGVTGAAGTGKSTLVDRLITTVRARGSTVGVIAVDPSSPFSGGAVLGDRVRMSGHAGDPGVFIRSMATRGHLGGLATATAQAVAVLDAAGRDVVIVETVGVGQDEVEVFRLAAVTVLVLVPGTGDDVQAIKAGVMEIADVFVVNKADRPDADRVVDAVIASLALAPPADGAWRPPVVTTQATTGQGVDDLWDTIVRCHAHRAAGGDDRAETRAADRLRLAISRQAAERVAAAVPADDWARVIADLAARRLSPEQAADRLLTRTFGPSRES
jgi:LAO/AO transport system kinase